MNKIIKYIGASAVVCMMAGCTTNFEDFNTNPYQPSKVPASNLLSTMFNVYACPQQNACQEINCMWASFSGQVTATANWSFGKNIFADHHPLQFRWLVLHIHFIEFIDAVWQIFPAGDS